MRYDPIVKNGTLINSSIEASRVIAVLRGLPRLEILSVARALARGGVNCIEVTMTSPNAFQSIEAVAIEAPEVSVGAGTVLTIEEVRRAEASGAGYIVSPNVNRDVIRETKRLGMLSMPGAMTPTEVAMAMDAGADIVKVFPASVVGYYFFREMKGPFPEFRLLATGGIGIENAHEFIKAGAFAVGMGSQLVPKEMVSAGRYDELEARARSVSQAVKNALA